jgi:hypothetical protein
MTCTSPAALTRCHDEDESERTVNLRRCGISRSTAPANAIIAPSDALN